MKKQLSYENFLHDVSGYETVVAAGTQPNKKTEPHAMTILRDDGLYRHLRFARPGTICMSFNLITWPGSLCYTGDMGIFVFSRLPDMFNFFRKSYSEPGRMDMRYWAEKLDAIDRNGVVRYDPDIFRERVKEWFAHHFEDSVVTRTERQLIWKKIEEEVLCTAGDGPDIAMRAAMEFTYSLAPGRREYLFQDFYEVDCKAYTHSFVWCCYALEWGIAMYDAQKQSEETK